MNAIRIPIKDIKSNPNYPRIIKDDKFKKLVQSIIDFPRMLEIRPIVVNDEMVVLGGNMRLKACKEAGLKEIPVIKASDLTPEQQREFIIKDNVGFGEWDWAMLANEWDENKLSEWGLDLPIDSLDEKGEYESLYEKPLQLLPEMEYVIILCNNDNYDEAREHFGLGFIQKNNGANVVAKERIITYEQYINRNTQ